MGIRDPLTVPCSPWQNGYAERMIGLIRRECLDHVGEVGTSTARTNENQRHPN
jgi:hypothetical protein